MSFTGKELTPSCMNCLHAFLCYAQVFTHLRSTTLKGRLQKLGDGRVTLSTTALSLACAIHPHPSLRWAGSQSQLEVAPPYKVSDVFLSPRTAPVPRAGAKTARTVG